MIGELARGREVLNLFCYTATASVQAALGGAVGTTSVDMSATYIDWARRNFELNQLDPQVHRLVRADCLRWIDEQQRDLKSRYGLIFLDPPTFSNSARMENSFDVQRDHGSLIEQAARLLAPGGVLVFSTNRTRFHLDEQLQQDFSLEDLTQKTLPRDFDRNPNIHRCWLIRPAGRSAADRTDNRQSV